MTFGMADDPLTLARCLEGTPYAAWRGTLAAADASFRAYWRLVDPADTTITVIAMVAPPDLENLGAFTRIDHLLRDHGLHAPEILTYAPDRGLIILEDLGTHSLRHAVEQHPDQTLTLYGVVADSLGHLQHQITYDQAVQAGILPYTPAEFWRETTIFLEWYLPHYSTCQPSADAIHTLESIHDHLMALALNVPSSVVLRDAMIDNFMIMPHISGVWGCGVLDFQDALWGPVTYDIASLMRDARYDVPSEVYHYVLDQWCAGYDACLQENLMTSFYILAVQRNLKILGVFTRLNVLYHKPKYLDFIPRIHSMLAQDLQHPALHPLKEWLNRHAGFNLP